MAATFREQQPEIGVRAPVKPVVGFRPDPGIIARVNEQGRDGNVGEVPLSAVVFIVGPRPGEAVHGPDDPVVELKDAVRVPQSFGQSPDKAVSDHCAFMRFSSQLW